MFFITSYSFARDLADDLKARQNQFIEELGELSDQENKVVKNILLKNLIKMPEIIRI